MDKVVFIESRVADTSPDNRIRTSTTVVGVMDDLFFGVKVSDAAKKAGLTPVFVKTADALRARLEDAPVLVVLDLNYAGVDPIQVIADMKAGEYRAVPLVGFVSHVQTDLRRRAEEAGCDVVVARSVFSTSLPEILHRHARLAT